MLLYTLTTTAGATLWRRRLWASLHGCTASGLMRATLCAVRLTERDMHAATLRAGRFVSTAACTRAHKPQGVRRASHAAQRGPRCAALNAHEGREAARVLRRADLCRRNRTRACASAARGAQSAARGVRAEHILRFAARRTLPAGVPSHSSAMSSDRYCAAAGARVRVSGRSRCTQCCKCNAQAGTQQHAGPLKHVNCGAPSRCPTPPCSRSPPGCPGTRTCRP